MFPWIRSAWPRARAAVRSEPRRSELIRFAVVGATAFAVDTAVFLTLKSTVLESRPVTAKVVAVLTAITWSYLLNKQWSFRQRGGRPGHHEAALFYLVSLLAIAINTAPLVVSRYALHLEVPEVSRTTQEAADFVAAQLVGTVLGMGFRFWAFVRVVFPEPADDLPDELPEMPLPVEE
ncbi:GtrA family protein [Nocardia sp. CA-119907]|uniref:GtrA family protein n=1 Tax=Nocardia sp. CA-119907 TaxID=3239973 RepID=UPI003D971E03